MSTKIYEAYRMPVKRVPDFIQTAYDHTFPRVVAYLKEIVPRLKEEVVKERLIKDWGCTEEDVSERLSNWKRFTVLMDMCKEAAQKSQKDFFDIECGWTFFIDGRYAYTFPWGPYWTRKDFKVPRFAKEYGYWNNTDMPEDVSVEEWEERREVWDRVTGEGRFSLVNHIINMQPLDRYRSIAELHIVLNDYLHEPNTNRSGNGSAGSAAEDVSNVRRPAEGIPADHPGTGAEAEDRAEKE